MDRTVNRPKVIVYALLYIPLCIVIYLLFAVLVAVWDMLKVPCSTVAELWAEACDYFPRQWCNLVSGWYWNGDE